MTSNTSMIHVPGKQSSRYHTCLKPWTSKTGFRQVKIINFFEQIEFVLNLAFGQVSEKLRQKTAYYMS